MTDTPVHDSFGLSYSAYFCVPRVVLQAMPIDWQRQFVALVEKLPKTPTYECRLRSPTGTYEADPLRDYRHGVLPAEMLEHIRAAFLGKDPGVGNCAKPHKGKITGWCKGACDQGLGYIVWGHFVDHPEFAGCWTHTAWVVAETPQPDGTTIEIETKNSRYTLVGPEQKR